MTEIEGRAADASNRSMNCPDCGAQAAEAAESCPDCGRSLAVPVGTVLAERYEIQTLLGTGGLGRVYRAHDRMLDELVAVKVLHPEAARSSELSRRFRSEIKLARKVRHRNVCAIHEYGEQGVYRFVAMELVDGVDLHLVIRERGALPPRDAFEVSIQVTKGLSAIHEAGVLHRDLKTPNIMQDSRGIVRLLDFGIAKLLSPTGTHSVTAVHRVVGTPEYMSPEQIRGDDLDERSDIYALGVVIFEIFTGVVPFQGRSPLDTLLRQVNDPPPLYGEAAARLPASLVPVLARAMAKDARDRPASARELLDALRESRRLAFPEASHTPPALPVSRTTGPPRPPLPQGRAPGPAAARSVRATPAAPPVVSSPVTASRPRIDPPPVAAPLAEKRTVVDLPAVPPVVGSRSRAWVIGAAGLLGLGAIVFLVARRPPTASTPTEPPLTLSAANVAAIPSPTVAPTLLPSPPASVEPTVATVPQVASPQPTPLPRPRTTPTPSPTPAPTPSATPTPIPTGGLDVEVRPGADVEIESRGAGKAPLLGVPLDPGIHLVTLQHPDYWPLMRRVSIEAGKTSRLDVDLSWEGVPRARSRVPPYVIALEGSPGEDPYFQRG
ncbi:MAG TPA: protein kinase, partial [Vicinamibacteria bacterium]